MAKNNGGGNSLLKVILILLMVVMIAASGLLIWLSINLVNKEGTPSTRPQVSTQAIPETTAPPTTETQPPETTMPEPETVIATATISAQGDLLMHKPVFDTCRQSDGSYNFESLSRYVKDTVSSFDYAMANLETTFGGDKYKYQGNPEFNCPDPLIDSVVDTGYDMLMTANNHAADTTNDGIVRTVDVIREAGIPALGTQLNGDEPKYSVVEINGIKVGMACYTYGYSVSGDGTKFSLNGLAQIPDNGTVNFFMNNNPDKLYRLAEEHYADMKADGAEATMFFIHWGTEYQTTENATQNKMAQKLCDIGYDVIVGGHPHVVQPVELLESTVDPDHKTVCIYSLGNAVSNQRTGISDLFPAGYTEDGALFTVTFEKYSDGQVYMVGTDVIPTWVNMHQYNGPKEYNILPLIKDQEDQWQETFGLTDHHFTSCQKSYNRTMGIVGEGLTECQTYLAQEKEAREQYYYDLAFNPEKVATKPVQTVPETTAETLAPAA